MLYEAFAPPARHAAIHLARVACRRGRRRLRGVHPVGLDGRRRTVLAGTVAADRFARRRSLLLLAVARGSACSTARITSRARAEHERGEFYPLLLFATAGMTLIAASADLIVVFLALEILSLSLYVLTGFSLRGSTSTEASMKYFLLGAFSARSSCTASRWPTARRAPRASAAIARRPGRADRPRRSRCSRSGCCWSGFALQGRARCRSTCGRPTCTRARRRP